MNLLWCCMIAVVAIANCAVDVEKTVEQVQNILKQNINLPRLSREEILQLLNDIRAEDARNSASREKSKEINKSQSTSEEVATQTETILPYEADIDNEVQSNSQSNSFEAYIPNEVSSTTEFPIKRETTTTPKEPSVMVVLPYTPRDGASLQELYTRPPRTEVVPASHIVPDGFKKPVPTVENTLSKIVLNNNAKATNNFQKPDLTRELQDFLNAHGLNGSPVQDHFLLPLEGFKPLPPAKIVDGNVQLPENLLLTYDLISPGFSKEVPSDNLYKAHQSDFELDTSSSESKQSVLPLDLPVRKSKTDPTPKPNYEPVDYDSIKVIPLQQGPKPEDEKFSLENELNKRQIENSTSETTTGAPSAAENSTVIDEDRSGVPSAPDAEKGASIADLEDSFGGAAPSQPGDSELPPPKKNGFYWMLDWNSFLEVGDGDTKVNIRFEPKLGDAHMFLPINTAT